MKLQSTARLDLGLVNKSSYFTTSSFSKKTLQRVRGLVPYISTHFVHACIPHSFDRLHKQIRIPDWIEFLFVGCTQHACMWQVKCSYPLQGFIVMKRQEIWHVKFNLCDRSNVPTLCRVLLSWKGRKLTCQNQPLWQVNQIQFSAIFSLTAACRNEMKKTNK